jgi:uncharacterized protein involved in exopolysaccharide biosynthesis
MSPSQLIAILRARWGSGLLILLLSIAAAYGYTLWRSPIYQSQVSVLVDVKPGDVGGGWAPALLAGHLATQIEVASSEAVALRALQVLQGRMAHPSDQRLTLSQVMSGLSVRPGRESHIMQLQWRGPEAAQTARVAEALAQALVDVSLELKTGPARQDARWMEQQLFDARGALEAAQMRLADFQRRAGLVGPEPNDHEMARLHELAQQIAQVQSDTSDAHSRQGVANETVADVMGSTLLNGLKADIARLEARRQDAAASLGPRHPQMERLDAELAALRARLAAETQQVLRSIDTRWRSGQARQRELSGALEAQRQRVLALNHNRAQLALLQQEVDAARRQFEAVSTQTAHTRQQSLLSQTGLLRLSAAGVPSLPLGPTPGQALAVGAVAGLVLAVAGALMLELVRRRVRSIDDIVQVTGLPVLASVPAAAAPGLYAPARRLSFDQGGQP